MIDHLLWPIFFIHMFNVHLGERLSCVWGMSRGHRWQESASPPLGDTDLQVPKTPREAVSGGLEPQQRWLSGTETLQVTGLPLFQRSLLYFLRMSRTYLLELWSPSRVAFENTPFART